MTGPAPGGAYRLARGIVRPPLMLATRRDWRGAENLPPEGGFVACINHISHLDPLTCAHFLNDHGRWPRFLAKESVFRAPVVGAIVRGAGQIPVRRESGDAAVVLAAAVDAVRAGECVVIYPEATLTRDPGLWPMAGKTGAARVALTTGCPVIPLAQWGVQHILAPYAKWPHPLPRKLVHVWAGSPVDLSAMAGRGQAPATLRAATDAILDAITLLLEGIRGESAPPHRWDPRQHGQPRFGDPRRPRQPPTSPSGGPA
jgi:1-acyl-sn-glycerol-3-phosphate acyltransferase